MLEIASSSTDELVARSRAMIRRWHERRPRVQRAFRRSIHRLPMRGGNGTPSVDWADLSGLTVLVVDDHDDSRLLLTQVFVLCGARVLAARDVAGALAHLGSARPDAIVTDLGMPNVDGLTFMAHVRGLNGYRTTPAIAVSGFTPDYARRASAAGFDAFVQKPFDFDSLCTKVAELVRQRRV